MSCFPELTYSVYADGELPGEEARRVEMHLESCASCRSLVEALRAENRALTAALLQPWPDAASTPAPAGERPRLGAGDLLQLALAFLGAALGLRGVFQWLAGLAPGDSGAALDWLNPLTLNAQLNLFFTALFYLVEQGASMLASILSAIVSVMLVLLLLGGALLLLRRGPRHAGAALILLLATLALPQPGWAMDIRRGHTVTIGGGQTVDDTLIFAGDTLRLDGVVTGNLIFLGRRLVLKGTVKGDLLSAGEAVDLGGEVGGNVVNFSRRITLHGKVNGSLYGIAQEMDLAETSTVAGDAVSFAESVRASGKVARDLMAFCARIEAAGSIGRDLTAYTPGLTLPASARVGGNLTIHAPRRGQEHIAIDSGAVIGGRKDTIYPGPQPSRFARPRFYLWRCALLLGALLVGWLLMTLAPGFFRGTVQGVTAWPRSLGLGFAVLVAAPIAMVLACITVLGLPLALLSLALYLAALYLAKIFVGTLLGRALLRGSGDAPRDMAAMLVGLLILMVGSEVPFVGGLLSFAVLCLGLGAFTWQLYRSARPAAA